MTASERVGVCTLRAWRYGGRVIVRVQARDDIEVSSSERVVLVSDVSAALEEVRHFLERLAADGDAADTALRDPEP